MEPLLPQHRDFDRPADRESLAKLRQLIGQMFE
jgi:hypothetical protein